MLTISLFLNILFLSNIFIRRLEKMYNNPFFAARVQKGYTQKFVSDKTGLSQQLISKIENDNNFETYQFSSIKKLCNFLKVDIKTI